MLKECAILANKSDKHMKKWLIKPLLIIYSTITPVIFTVINSFGASVIPSMIIG